jgi:hypothetical protein
MTRILGLFGRDLDSLNSDLLVWIHQKIPPYFFFHQIRIHQIGESRGQIHQFCEAPQEVLHGIQIHGGSDSWWISDPDSLFIVVNPYQTDPYRGTIGNS